MDETWLYHFDPKTKQKLVEWRYSGSPRPKRFRVQKSAGKVLASTFLGSRRHPPHWLSSKRPNDQSGVLLIPAGAIGGRFEGKTPQKFTKGFLFLLDTVPAHRALAAQKKLAYLGFHCLDHPPYSQDLAPSDYHLLPWTEKTIQSSLFFFQSWGHCCHGGMVGLTNFWIFLNGLQKLEQLAKKCILLRGEYVE